MDSPESETLGSGERRKDTVPNTPNTSGQAVAGSKSRMSLKRSIGNPTKVKSKKQKKARIQRSAQLGYTVQQGEDMLLVISSTTSQYDGAAWTLPKKGRKRKKITNRKPTAGQIRKKKAVCVHPRPDNNPAARNKDDTNRFVPEKEADHRWGQSLPEEVLINIFQMVVDQDGAVPFLCRVGRVCRLWNAAASSPALWRKVTVGHCWCAPGKPQLPRTEKKIKDTLTWLAQNRFSQLRDFSLCHWKWKNGVNYVVEIVALHCPHLRALTLSYCTGLTASAFHSLGLHSVSLQSINLQCTEFQVEGLLDYLENHGDRIRNILFTHGPKCDRLLTAISRGCCPNLELLEVNTRLDRKDGELPICIQAMQIACPKLKTFRMLNVRPLHKVLHNSTGPTLGFPLLEELCIATTSYSYMTDNDLLDILFGSTNLRVLDLRGCSRITPTGLAALPCLELECLFWGQYFSSCVGLSSPKTGFYKVAQKWGRSMQQLDIANQQFPAEDLELAMSYLARETETTTLRSLNLSGTRIAPAPLRAIISQITSLNYLNLSSCRYLPRGVKKIYRGQDDIQQLLDKLG